MALAETTMRTATIRYPIELSIRIRTYCLLHRMTLSEFFAMAARAVLQGAKG